MGRAVTTLACREIAVIPQINSQPIPLSGTLCYCFELCLMSNTSTARLSERKAIRCKHYFCIDAALCVREGLFIRKVDLFNLVVALIYC